ncbi:chloride channel protein [Salsipaludibacter albus]|uniref:chloride channel protein n=1 Tax=Salsipaludibacter albus TaxID=2849650 RepID=UPI001EE44D73|nr:chloride channel protein [Salsipaludibacter albus]MBY5161316.1 chloride channel protein [Salsipaludibacter albus]
MSTDTPPTRADDPHTLIRRRNYVVMLLVGAVLGLPVAVVAYGFLGVVGAVQDYLFTTLPGQLGFTEPPSWWSIPLLVLGGLGVAATIRRLPGTGGHKPAEGFKTGGPVRPADLPGIALAAFLTLALGVVLGPEAPLIAIGSGLGVLAMRLLDRGAPDMAVMVVSGAGSFAAIATLLGSPLSGAFLLMEAVGLGGAMLGVVLVPGLLAAAIGALVFVGLDQWSGLGTFSLGVADLPAAGSPTGVQFLWAIGIGLAAALLGAAITRASLHLQGVVERGPGLRTPLVGLAIGGLVLVFVETTGQGASWVLFSGQEQLGPLISGAGDWTVGALLLLLACKGLAYTLALSSFRGGPVFPAMFLGAAGGVVLSHLPGLPLVAAVGMGIGAMTVAMLGLPLVSVLLAALVLQADGLQLVPVIIVAVVTSWVVSARLRPDPDDDTEPQPEAPPDASGAHP